MSNEERIKTILEKAGRPLCDDCLTRYAHFKQRQVANSICRSLEIRGMISRNRGSCFNCKKFKIVNSILIKSSSEPAKSVPSKEIEISGFRPWYWEGNIQSTLVSYLVNQGYIIRSVSDTAARSQGKDIVARDSKGQELWVTVKGFPKKSQHVQARHWFADAIFSLILYRNENSFVKLALALPDTFATYINLTAKTVWLRKALTFKIFWVSEDKQIRIE